MQTLLFNIENLSTLLELIDWLATMKLIVKSLTTALVELGTALMI